ncbi:MULTISPECIES: radical SAM protein [Streptomyces]|uniref:radical SAM protein n=1 Tax=Streptomyces lycopersici TaxID=2974589 RepID=UPI0021D1050A|nr:radical SAM protein [Streptomyces sp. NEAU-383]
MSGVRAIRRQHQNVADKPFIVIWESTRACPLACPHCRAEAVPDRDPRELDTAAARDLLRQVAAFGQPAPLFVITGGDPFQRSDLTELIAYGKATGVRVAVSPSGTPTLTPGRLRNVHEAGVGLTVPAKTTEAHHFRRVALQRKVLADAGEDHIEVLGLGPLYRRLRDRAAELGLDAGRRRARRPPLDVNAGRGFVFVSHTGTVHPSGFLPLGAGSVRERPLTEIYRASELFTGLRDADRLGGRCGRCEFRRVCGGSRSRAYGITGDPYAEEPWCGYRPGSFPYQRELAALLTGDMRHAESGAMGTVEVSE